MKRIFTIRLSCLITVLLFLSWISNAYSFTPPKPAFSPNRSRVLITNTDPQALCEFVCPGDLNFTLAPGECNLVVNYDVHTTGDCSSSVPVQTSGLPSGALFPIGVTHNCFTVDLPPLGLPDGDIECCFDVVVSGYPNPITSLVCNDLVFFSLNGDCEYCINGGEILEGGPYACFDNYIVELDKIPPYGNGPWVSGCVNATDIGKTYQVRITDPISLNKCWGNVKIEDKQPPELECHNILIPCNANPNTNAEPAPAITGYQKGAYKGIQDSIGAAGSPTPDIHTYSFDYSYLPGGTAALDVNCRIKLTGHTSLSDLKITVTAPDGTSADVFTTTGCAGQEWPIDVLFDDEGADILGACALLNANAAPIQCMDLGVANPTALSVFDGKNTSGIWTVTIRDDHAMNEGVIETVGLEVMVNVPQKLPTDNCSANVTLTHVDTEDPGDCASGYTKIIHRSWTATDAYGNTSTCIQDIKLLQASLEDVVLPADYDGVSEPSLSCNDTNYPTPEWMASQGLQGSPLVFGLPEGCNIAWTHEDLVIKVCDGTYKIRRDWSIINSCSGELLVHHQTIKVVDSQGPTMDCPQNMTVSTDPFNCCGTIDLPDVIITDGCSRIKAASATIMLFDPVSGLPTGVETLNGSLTDFSGNDWSNPDTLGAFGFTACLPQGTHSVTYVAEDDCGNTATCAFQITVDDNVPPVAVCDAMSTVAIGLDDAADCFGPAGPGGAPAAFGPCEFGGVTWVNAATFDNGSYDACGNLRFTIRRMAPYSDCVLGLNVLNGQTPCNDFFPDFPSEFERAISEGDSIKFYACEVGTTQPIALRVYQLDANGGFDVDQNGMLIFNECIIQVQVQDKTKPSCTPPPDVTVSCEQFDPSLFNYGVPVIMDNCCLDTNISYLGQCGLSQTVNYSGFDSICNKGTIQRIFHAVDCHGNSSQCVQRIVVNYSQDYYVHFPNDVIVTQCAVTGFYGEPSFFGEDCELLAKSYEDQVFTVVPDACFKIERRWSVINWCTFNPGLPATTVPNPNPNAIPNHPSNLPGPIVSACDAIAPWNPTIVKINPTDPVETNYCSFWSTNTNRYEYLQIIKIIDTEAPVIANCPGGSPLTITDSTQNDPALWHQVFNPSLPAEDLAEGKADLGITSSDDCAAGNLSEIKFLLFLDLDHDGVQESVVDAANLPGADTIRYNNVNTPGYLGGTPMTFDSRPVPTSQKWHFALQNIHSPTDVSSAVRWNTASAPNTFVVPQLPVGTHHIKWIVPDPCGNESVCEHTFTIQSGPTSGIDAFETDGFALYQNEPNPFSDKTNIGFRLPNAAEATLSVFDTEGRLLFAKTDHFSQGLHSIALQGEWLLAPGVLYYKLESGAQVAWKKMVVIR